MKKISPDIFIVLIIILVGTASFGLGRLSSVEKNNKEITVSEIGMNSMSASAFASQQQEEEGSGMVVASKNGTKYHYPWCSGAKVMKEENKIFFNSIEEAKKAGYGPAGNCKGLE